MIRFPCPACKAGLKAPPERAGVTMTCPKCKTRLKVPSPRPTPTEVVADVLPAGEGIQDALPAGPAAPSMAPQKRAHSRFPVWMLAIIIPAAALLCCVAGIGFVVYRNSPQSAIDKGRPSGERRPADTVASAPDAPPVATVQAQQLYDAYTDNEAAADLKYTGKVVEFWDVCAPLFDYTPRKDSSGHYYLDFNCGMGYVRAIFRSSEQVKLAEFNPNQNAKVVVRGVCRGISGNVVRLSDTVLVSVSEGNGLPRK